MPHKNQEKRNEYHRKWAKNHPEWWERRRERNKQIVRDAKAGVCVDCKNPFPYYVMEFDHREGTVKENELSTIAKKHWSEDHIRKEIAKCDTVCANCHRERTAKRGGYSEIK